MWITNGGFADVYVVFAKVNGEKFTAFIVERTFLVKRAMRAQDGNSRELDDADLPGELQGAKENVLHEIGEAERCGVQYFERRAVYAGRSCVGERERPTTSSTICEGAQGVRKTDRPFWNDPGKAREMAIQIFAVESMCIARQGNMRRR